MKKVVLLFLVGCTFAYAEFFFEGYAGAMAGLAKTRELKTKDTYGIPGLDAAFHHTALKRTDFGFLGGIKAGAWFANERCSSYWRHFGLMLDFSYNPINFSHSSPTDIEYFDSTAPGLGVAQTTAPTHISMKGPSMTLSLLFPFRMGFLKTETNPFGRLQPYIDIGPAVLFYHPKTRITVSPNIADNHFLRVELDNDYSISSQRKWLYAPALAAETGLFYKIKKCSIDFAVSYRFARPHLSYGGDLYSVKTTFHLFGIRLGAAYHF